VVKLIAFFKRSAGLSVEAFQEHWRTVHAELVVRQRGLRRYVQNHTLLSGYRRGEPDYDGVAEAWFDDTQAMRDLADSPEYAAVREDEANFIDAASMGVVLCNEVAIVDRPEPGEAVKSIAFLTKQAELLPEQFQAHWREKHGPIAAAIPGIERYVQNHVRLGGYARGRTPVFDGVPISWFRDLDSLRASGKSPEYEATRADETNFLSGARLPFVVATAREIEVP